MGLGFVLLALRGSGNTCLVGLGLVRLKISSSYVLHLTKIFSGSIIELILNYLVLFFYLSAIVS